MVNDVPENPLCKPPSSDEDPRDSGRVDNTLGQDYKYSKYIKQPKDLKMRDAGSALSDNIAGIISYTDVLLSGNTKAHKGSSLERNEWKDGQPLGNRYFLKTDTTCKAANDGKDHSKDDDPDVTAGTNVQRYVYIDNVPSGKLVPGLPPIGNAKGLIPGVFGNLSRMVPDIGAILSEGSGNDCHYVTLKTRIPAGGQAGSNGTHETPRCGAYVTKEDLKNITPCVFKENEHGWHENTITKNGKNSSDCTAISTFISANENLLNMKAIKKNKTDTVESIYIASVGCLLVYLLFKLCN